MSNDEFTAYVLARGRELFRDMPWRNTLDPYQIMVSELMLQQTQVGRVVPKYEAFIMRFPRVSDLANAQLDEVLRLWQGLGYNRRAKYLLSAARQAMELYDGALPHSSGELQELPGIGKNTAGAICVYAYNQPTIFIETNVRTVYLHHLFSQQEEVSDRSIEASIKQTLPRDKSRQFYWALMDYGSWLKASGIRNTNRSKHYRKQSPLSGSVREVRGVIIRILSNGPLQLSALHTQCQQYGERYPQALDQLFNEGLIMSDAQLVRLTNI